MNQFGIILLDGLSFASWLFVVSAGLTFIFGVLRILNIAHGAIYALGAYMTAYLSTLLLGEGHASILSFVVMLLAALITGLVAGPLIERVFLKRAYGKDEVIGLLTTFALFLILEDLIKVVWGIDPKFIDGPFSMFGNFEVAGINYAVYPFLLTVVAVLTGLSLWLIINHTSFGRQVTAVIADREISGAIGINVPRVDTLAFTLGTVLAAIAGAFVAPMISVEPGLGIEIIVLAFAVIGIGGLGSVPGAALGCLLVGVSRAAAVHLFPELELFVVYALLVLVLIVRPQGLFGGREVRRI